MYMNTYEVRRSEERKKKNWNKMFTEEFLCSENSEKRLLRWYTYIIGVITPILLLLVNQFKKQFMPRFCPFFSFFTIVQHLVSFLPYA